MYVVTPFPNILYALDLKKPGAMKWKYEPKPASAAQGVACCDFVNRGCVFDDGRIFYNTLDCHTVAVDAKTGKEVWKTKVGDINKGETMTMAPLVVKGKVLVGNSGGEFGVRGWLTALDAKTGKVAWKACSTGPDADCLIGPRFKPFYQQDVGKDLGVTTWPPDHWRIGGGTVWGWISYDPELNLIFYGTGNPGTWNHELRPGRQQVDLRHLRPRPGHRRGGLVLPVEPARPVRPRRHQREPPARPAAGRRTGRCARSSSTPSATGTSTCSTASRARSSRPRRSCGSPASKGVDLATGKLIPNEEKTPTLGKVIRDIAPIAPGAKDWQPVGLLAEDRPGLHAALRRCRWTSKGSRSTTSPAPPTSAPTTKNYADPVDPGDGSRGRFTAWDPVKKKAAWKIKEKFPVWSGALATAGDVVFYGTMDGWFKAVNAKTGDLLWKFKTGSGIIGQPVTYQGPDGKQYVAILSGVGGWAGAIVVGGLDASDPNAAMGFVNAMKDLPDHTTKGGTLYVFSLP